MSSSKKKSSKKQTKVVSQEQRPAKRKKIVSLAEYEAGAKDQAPGKTEPAAGANAPDAAPTADVAPRSKKSAKADQPAKAPKSETSGVVVTKEKAPRPSGLNAAATILAEAKAPMKVKEITTLAAEKGLWTPKGKTPWATLYSAIIREISVKGKDSRFVKTDRGLFELAK
jgi:hypothetical protein